MPRRFRRSIAFDPGGGLRRRGAWADSKRWPPWRVGGRARLEREPRGVAHEGVSAHSQGEIIIVTERISPRSDILLANLVPAGDFLRQRQRDRTNSATSGAGGEVTGSPIPRTC